VTTGAVVAGVPAAAQAPVQPSPSPTADQTPACERGLHKVRDYQRYGHRVYLHRAKVSSRAHHRLAYMQECQHTPRARRAVARLHNRFLALRAPRVRERTEMQHYKAHPLPWCTWGPESGIGRPEWSMLRYRQANVSGGDGGGKYQIMMSTWSNFGGRRYTQSPVAARPVVQERVARRIAADGLHHWVNC